MQKLHINILFTLIWSFAFSQQYTHFNTKNGLPSNHIYRITQDYQGFIWILTDKGMVKYNGNEFKTFTTKEGLPANDIWDVRIGHDNKVWYFTKATRLGYIQNDSVYSFESTIKNNVLFPRVINQNKKEVFFSDYEKTFHLKDNLWDISINDNKDVNALNINHKTIKTLVLKGKNSIIELIDHTNKSIKTFNYKNYSVLDKYRGQLNDSLFCFIGAKHAYLINLNTQKSTIVTYPLGKKQLTRFSAVNDNIQFSGEDYISFLNNKYQLTNTIKIPKKFNSHFSFVDKNKNLWIATFSDGVYFLPYAKQKSYYSLQQLKVGKLQKVKNNIIASVYKKGFYKYDTILNKFKPLIVVEDFVYSATYIKELESYYFLADTTVIKIHNNKKVAFKNQDVERSLIFHKNALYGYTSFGINKINPQNFNVLKEYYQNGIRSITPFKDKLILAAANGIHQFLNDTITRVSIENNLFNKPTIALAKLNNQQLIVGTDGFGAYITNLKTIDQLEQSNYLNVQQIIVKNNAIWLATNKGVWHYKKEKNTIKLIKKYTTNDGLSTNLITNIVITDKSILASSNNGVSTIPITNKENNQFLKIYFDKLTYNHKPIKNNQVKYAKNNHLQVKIASINYFNEKNRTVEYQLLPIQNKWITTTSNQISFNDLLPNNYQLKIKSNGKENQFTFKILPLWYQSKRFRLFLLFFGFIVLYLFNKWNQNRIEAIEKKKAEIKQKLVEQELYALRSQMNPHFVFNSLSAIQYYINNNDMETSEAYLVKFSQLIRKFFELSKETEITLKEEIALLKNYLELEKLRFKEKLNFNFIVDETLNIDTKKIPTMLLQPIVENAVNHGIFNKLENGLITVEFKKTNQTTYQVIITDDGVGFVNTTRTTSKKKNSSMVLKDRLRYLNEHQNWRIIYFNEELNPSKKDKGNVSKFTITHI